MKKVEKKRIVEQEKKVIKLIGIETHGLKKISVEIPHDQITVITGLSGSGKSSLAIDTLFAEGQRRYLESLSSYARQFLNKFEKPEFEKIEGLRPAIAIEQKTQGHNPRSTVGTVTEIYDYLRVLFARIGIPFSPFTNQPLQAYSASEITKLIYETCYGSNSDVASNSNSNSSLETNLKTNKKCEILAPIAKARKGTFKNELQEAQKQGFRYAIIDGEKYNLDQIPELDKQKLHDIEIVIGSFDLEYCENYEIEAACAIGLKVGSGIITLKLENKTLHCSSIAACPVSGFSLQEQTPRLFSFNSPVGACKKCFGLGCIHDYDFGMNYRCQTCQGKRLNPSALCVRIGGLNISDICILPLDEARDWILELELNKSQKEIAEPLVNEISKRLIFLCDVGLSYLTLERSAETLSGGESQRIRLASQIGSGLEGVLYVLDEPSVGLHPKDQDRLINTLKKLRDLGNTIVVVEHDEGTIQEADYIIEMGPGAGIHGGEVVFQGSKQDLLLCEKSITAPFLDGRKKIEAKTKVVDFEKCEKLIIRGAKINNLKNLTATIPLKHLVGVCGVSGSGKSSFVLEVLAKNLQDYKEGEIDKTLCELDGVIPAIEIIDQSPIGRTPRSNPATYTGIMTNLRDWYASLPEAKARGYTSSRFSFNVDLGRCRLCSGEGVRHIEMHFLPDIEITCESCLGRRYNEETCEIKYEGLSIADVLELNIEEASKFFAFLPPVKRMLQTMCDVHLGYLKLGQNAVTLSGGEAQRLKLARILGVKKNASSTLYILDEPTTGLHFEDIQALLTVLRKLADAGNTVLVIEHHIDLLKSMDWLLEIGPEGGKNGGYLIAEGPWKVLAEKKTPTGLFF